MRKEFLEATNIRTLIDPILTELENVTAAVVSKHLPTSETALEFLKSNNITPSKEQVSAAQTAFKGTQSSHYLTTEDIFNEGPLLHNLNPHGLTKTGLDKMRKRGITKEAMKAMYKPSAQPTNADLDK